MIGPKKVRGAPRLGWRARATPHQGLESLTWRPRPSAGLLLAAMVALAAVLASNGPLAGAAEPAAQPAGDQELVLASQTSWVTAKDPVFQMHLSVPPSLPPESTEIEAVVFSVLHNRTAFTRTLQGRVEGSVLATTPPEPLSQLPQDSTGARLFQISTDGSGPTDLNLAGEDGVYPVRVELRSAGSDAVISQLTTYLIYSNVPAGAPKLGFSWVLPVYAAPALQPNGQERPGAPASDALASLASALQAYPSVPVNLAPNPETVEGLATSGRLKDLATVASLRSLVSNRSVHPIVSNSYVPVDLGAMAGSGVGQEVADQVARGSEELAATLGVKGSSQTWVVTGSIDQSGLALLAPDVTQLVIPEDDLTAVASNLTPSAPFQVETHSSYSPEAFGADATLDSHFTNGPDPVLGAHQLLADLAQIYFESPSETPRVVVADTPFNWIPNASFLTAVLSALQSSPIVSPLTLDSAFAQFPHPSTTQKTLSNATNPATLPGNRIRACRQRLVAFSSAVGPANPVPGAIGDLLLVSESSQLRSQQRSAYLSGCDRQIEAQLEMLTLPPDRSITLTARTGRIPVTIVSAAPYPLHAVLQVASEKLSFPDGSTKLLSLDQRNYVAYFDVSSRSSGDFPLTVHLVSPQGGLVLLQGNFTVRSTAASWVGVALSVGAGAFLVLWWARSWVRGRRNRKSRQLAGPG